MSKIAKSIYRVLFVNQGKLYELYAREIYQGDLYGFIEVEELIFGERSSVLINPAEEKLQNEFVGVKRTFIPSRMLPISASAKLVSIAILVRSCAIWISTGV